MEKTENAASSANYPRILASLILSQRHQQWQGAEK
jgi:hypothetical protein